MTQSSEFALQVPAYHSPSHLTSAHKVQHIEKSPFPEDGVVDLPANTPEGNVVVGLHASVKNSLSLYVFDPAGHCAVGWCDATSICMSNPDLSSYSFHDRYFVLRSCCSCFKLCLQSIEISIDLSQHMLDVEIRRFFILSSKLSSSGTMVFYLVYH